MQKTFRQKFKAIKNVTNQLGRTVLGFGEKHWLLATWLVVGIFTVVTLMIGMQQSIWFDEAYSINLAKHSINDLINLTAIDVHPPAYYIFLHFWGGIFGFGELSLRLSSILLMALAILLMSVLVKNLLGKKIAILSTLFVGLSPMIVRYGFEIRMYAMATMFSVLASLILVKTERERRKTKRRVLQFCYAGIVTLSMLTLYYTIIIWATHFCYLIYRTIKTRKSLVRQEFWLVYLLAVIMFLPWGVVAIKQFTNGALAQISEPLTLINLLGVFSFNMLYSPIWQLGQIDGLLILVLIILVGYTIMKLLQSGFCLRGKTEVDFLIFLAVAPIVIEFLICLIKPMYVERYLVYSAPFLIAVLVYLFYGKGWMPTGRGFRLGFMFILIIIGLISLNRVGNFNFQRMQRADVKEVAEELRTQKLPILADSPYEAMELGYYLGEVYFYAPYETLRGGYAPFDKSSFKIATSADFKKFTCLNYAHYSANLGHVLSENGFQSKEKDGGETTLKYTTMCKK